jgi:hypothetical protein
MGQLSCLKNSAKMRDLTSILNSFSRLSSPADQVIFPKRLALMIVPLAAAVLALLIQ